jgi:hypothetical protein
MVQQGIQRFQAEDLQVNSDERGMGIALGAAPEFAMRPIGSWPRTPACVKEHAGVPETSCMAPFAAPFINSINKSTR